MAITFLGRDQLRLPGYDYSRPGLYFVTMCVSRREHMFGEVVDGKMILNAMGDIVSRVWFDLPNHYGNIALDEFIIMPNHVHGIIRILDSHNAYTNAVVRAGLKPAPTATDLQPAPTNANADTIHIKNHPLTEIIRGFKTFSSREINKTVASGYFCWHRSFHERIIRDIGELDRIRSYIQHNPVNWLQDAFAV